MIEELFSKYQNEARKADILFKTISEKYPLSVKCRIRCCDCCHAIFGVFPIEAAYINYHLNRLDRKIRRDVQRRAEKSETEMLKAADKLKDVFKDDPKMQVYGLGKQRVRCPLLSEKDECVLYENRPIICRVYGVPFSLKQKNDKEVSYVCGLSGFQAKVSYPAVKLDKIYHILCEVSKELLTKAGSLHPERFDNMMAISKVVRISFETIVKAELE